MSTPKLPDDYPLEGYRIKLVLEAVASDPDVPPVELGEPLIFADGAMPDFIIALTVLRTLAGRGTSSIELLRP